MLSSPGMGPAAGNVCAPMREKILPKATFTYNYGDDTTNSTAICYLTWITACSAATGRMGTSPIFTRSATDCGSLR